MGDKMRWRYGDTNPVISDVSENTVIEIGDLVSLVCGYTYPASVYEDKSFLGVAMQRSRVGESKPIRVATSGVFEFECDTCGEKTIGDKVGVCEKQEVRIVDKKKIGKIAKNTVSNSVLIDIHSKIMGK